HFKPAAHWVRPIGKTEVRAFMKSLRRQLFSRQGPAYAKFLLKTALFYPKMFPEAVRWAILGYHFERLVAETVAVEDFRESIRHAYAEFEQKVIAASQALPAWGRDIGVYAQQLLVQMYRQYERIHQDFRHSVHGAWQWFQAFMTYCTTHIDEVRSFYTIAPIFQRLFTGDTWETFLRTLPYRIKGQRFEPAGEIRLPQVIAIAPATRSLALVRSLETFFGELGIKVLTVAEQLAHLSQDSLAWLTQDPEGALSLLDHYLHTLGQSVDYVVVPLAAEMEGVIGKVQSLFLEAEQSASTTLPGVIRFSYSRRLQGLRQHLIPLGLTFTGDREKVEQAYHKALALLPDLLSRS
ncbi:MAG: hypothetical protein D6736_12860, partial [Nitrospinota bacterium]